MREKTAAAGENMKSRKQWGWYQTDSAEDSEQLQNNEMKLNRTRCLYTHLSCAMAVFAVPLFSRCFFRVFRVYVILFAFPADNVT